ncbi:MAG: hypothetical protein QG654_495 [Patescibacteria group bacterium]|jgi:hypothetical protein|nr:hypothetical protein [Patescibacteria group bacterium]
MEFPTTTDKQYPLIIEQLLELFSKKAKDYGTAWRILRLPSLTDQIFIKAQRIRTLQKTGENKVGDGIESELIGIANYSAMALVQIAKGVAETPDLSAEEATHLVSEELNKAKDLMLKKNHDYGEAWRSMRISSIVDLILMKLLRIKQIEENQGKTLVSEGIDANYLDMINYAVFALIHIKEGKDPMN